MPSLLSYIDFTINYEHFRKNVNCDSVDVFSSWILSFDGYFFDLLTNDNVFGTRRQLSQDVQLVKFSTRFESSHCLHAAYHLFSSPTITC